MAPIYEQRLQEDLNHIRDGVAAVSSQVETAVNQAVKAILHQDKPLANLTILGDLPINRAIRVLDRRCHYFIARHLPSAGHLRFISSVMRVNIALERIGDYAATIAREAKTLNQPLGKEIQAAIAKMADEALSMLHQAVEAFNERNADLAHATKGFAYQLDHSFANAFNLLTHKGEADVYSTVNLFGILIVFNRLERISDQAKNICEETIFAVTGESKPPKMYRILFLDETDDCRTQMAVGIAKKLFPVHGEYTSAGREAGHNRPACAQFMMDLGLDLSDPTPKVFSTIPEDWKEKHVIVSLSGAVDEYMEQVPFHAIALQWDDIPTPPPAEADSQSAREQYEVLYQHLALHIQNLMDMLHGEEAP